MDCLDFCDLINLAKYLTEVDLAACQVKLKFQVFEL